MADNQTIKERLLLFIAYLGIGQAKFEKRCGLANGYVNNIRKSITPEKLQKIALQYPELNAGWLMTGEGEMIRSVVNANASQITNSNVGGKNNSVNVNSESETSRLMTILEKQQEQTDEHLQIIKRRDEQIDRLIAVIEKITPNSND